MSSAYLFFHEQQCEFPDPHPPHLWGEITLTAEEEVSLLRRIDEPRIGGTPEQKRLTWGNRHTRSCPGVSPGIDPKAGPS